MIELEAADAEAHWFGVPRLDAVLIHQPGAKCCNGLKHPRLTIFRGVEIEQIDDGWSNPSGAHFVARKHCAIHDRDAEACSSEGSSAGRAGWPPSDDDRIKSFHAES